MKRFLVLMLSIIMILSMVGCSNNDNEEVNDTGSTDETQEVKEGDNSYEAGTYTIETTGHNGVFDVDVVFDEDEIVDIIAGDNQETGFMADSAFEDMISNIIDRQSLDVDTISGATVSGLAIRTAVGKAVEEAGGDKAALDIPAEEDKTVYEDVNADVVVIGSGAAGMAATMQADELGMNVILVEQLGLLGGSSVRAGYMVGGDTKVQKEQDIDFSVQDWIDYMVKPRPEKNDLGLYHEESSLEMASNAGKNIDWLYDLGVEFGPVNLDWQHYGPEGARVGPYAMNAFKENLDEKDIDYRLNTKAIDIIMEDGKAKGISVEAPDGSNYNINADSVIVATGGFFGNKEMVEKYDPDHAQFPTDVSIGADGSGMLMAEDIGGVLKYMDQANYHGMAASWNGASRSLTLPAGNGALAVNAEGKRYANEAGAYELLTKGTMDQENSIVYCIMNQELMDLDVIKNDHGLSNIVEMYEVADTIEELAEKLGIDKEGLKNTVNDYESYVENGEDLEFGKDPLFMRSDFASGPYYGVEASVENHTNHGGIVVDGDNHILNGEDQIIPGLFAAGECAASRVQGFYTYQACIETGRMSAKTAHEEMSGN